jgi:hypothetical protein
LDAQPEGHARPRGQLPVTLACPRVGADPPRESHALEAGFALPEAFLRHRKWRASRISPPVGRKRGPCLGAMCVVDPTTMCLGAPHVKAGPAEPSSRARCGHDLGRAPTPAGELEWGQGTGRDFPTFLLPPANTHRPQVACLQGGHRLTAQVPRLLRSPTPADLDRCLADRCPRSLMFRRSCRQLHVPSNRRALRRDMERTRELARSGDAFQGHPHATHNANG